MCGRHCVCVCMCVCVCVCVLNENVINEKSHLLTGVFFKRFVRSMNQTPIIYRLGRRPPPRSFETKWPPPLPLPLPLPPPPFQLCKLIGKETWTVSPVRNHSKSIYHTLVAHYLSSSKTIPAKLSDLSKPPGKTSRN